MPCGIPRNVRKLMILLVVVLLLLLVSYIVQMSRIASNDRQAIETELASLNLELPINYKQQIKPILEKRCIVCHGCYDAPCQLKLSSIEGLQRGASEIRVYEPRRIESIPSARLFIDAKNTQQWRSQGFYSVINEQTKTPFNNLQNSVLYRLLQLKKKHPQPSEDKLPDSFSLELNRKQTCPKPDAMDEFSKDHPLWGMPYAMPNLSTSEYKTLVTWVAQGSPAQELFKPSTAIQLKINQWEKFLNQKSNKQKLVSRYLYEHLFHAHIHFINSGQREFYRLVRSTTASGTMIDEIATTRPNDDPGRTTFYYRLLPYTPSIVSKNHIVYEFSDKRLQRFRELFLKPTYNVLKLPPYNTNEASNPFKTFSAIPANSRYRFLLDDAHFFIEGFIKGPVCRGQLALNVIEDQFWVVFFNPDKPMITNNSEFIDKMATELQMPADYDNNFDLFRIWTDYWKGQRRYMEGKQAWFKSMGTHELEHAMNYIWDGGGNNPNAALTVFRHFNSGSVSYGLVGSNPETTWVIDFPLLERIHYLLVADFNIFGNIGHRMSTRIYMDFLRMEGEDSFLAFLPINKRKSIRDSWYVGQRSSIEKLFSAPQEWLTIQSVIGYKTDDPQQELYLRIKNRLKGLVKHTSAMNQCGQLGCNKQATKSLETKTAISRADKAMSKIAKLQGVQLHSFPDVAFVRVKTDKPDDDLVYSLIRNKAYKNVTSFLADARERDRSDVDKDTMTVVKWLEGSYPNFFFSVPISEIEVFSKRCALIRTSKDYEEFVNQYGVRRTNPLYWDMADWFQDNYKNRKPILSGLFDLNRYHNR